MWVRRTASLAAAALLLAGCGGGGTSSGAGPGPGSAQTGTATTVDAGTPFACPDPQDRTAMTGADTLPSGASAALLCFRANRDPWVAPREPLRIGLDRLVRLVNARQVHDPSSDDACGGVGAPAWTMVLRYDTGTRTISGDNGGCWSLAVGPSSRVGAKRVFSAYLHELLSQRRRETAPVGHTTRPVCPPPARALVSFSPLADAAHLTAAVLCAPGDHRYDEIPLSRAQLGMLRHEFATATTRRTHLHGPVDCHALAPRVGGAIVGVDDWGDPFTVLAQCDTYRVLQPARDHYLFARMLPSTARMLGGLLTAH